MKNRSTLLSAILLSLAFGTLFYPFEVGLNATLFHFLTLSVCLWQAPHILHSVNGRMSFALNILAGLSLFVYGNVLSAFASLFTLAILAGLTLSPYSSSFYSLLVMPGNLIAAPFRVPVLYLRNRLYAKPVEVSKPILAYVIVPIFAVGLFTALYIGASPDFAILIRDIHFNFSIGRFLFTSIMGSILVYSILYMRKKRKTRLKEAIFRDQLSSRMRAGIRGMDVPSEHRMGILTLVLLVLLISIVILAETFVIPRSSDATSFAPAYSFEVHRSVLALIVSIVLSILCIQWLLRYTDRSHPRPVSLLKMLSIGWMILNLALVTIAFLKNIDYVRHLGLSYLRLGVFFYLAAASIGIIYTMKRILNDHNLWYLVSRNAFAALTLMVMAACVPWDMVITRFNIHTAITENKALDMYYIRSLRHYDRVALHEYDMRNQKSVSHDIITWDANGNYYFIDTYHREYILSGTLNEFINVYKANHYDKNR